MDGLIRETGVLYFLSALPRRWHMKIHELKTWPDQFSAMRYGMKTGDVRRNDRNFQPGDLVRFLEWELDRNKDAGVIDALLSGGRTRLDRWGAGGEQAVLKQARRARSRARVLVPGGPGRSAGRGLRGPDGAGLRRRSSGP